MLGAKRVVQCDGVDNYGLQGEGPWRKKAILRLVVIKTDYKLVEDEVKGDDANAKNLSPHHRPVFDRLMQV